MGKISGSYESVVRGVSEQSAQNRRSGQHTAQVNMISDPVRGLARRHGSILQNEIGIELLPDRYEDLVAATVGTKVFPFFIGNDEYDLVIRTEADTQNLGRSGFCFVFNKTTRKFMQVIYNPGEASLEALIAGGASAVVNIGRYVYIAGNTVKPTAATSDAWDNNENRGRIAATIQLGAYSRKYSVTLVQHDGTKVTGTYTTPSSSYPGTLDTSDIPLYNGTEVNKDYQKLVNDRVNAYNSEVTKWIGTAAAAITPANIASQIATSLRAQGYEGAGVSGNTVIIADGRLATAEGSDGGDGSLIRVVGADVDNVDLVNTVHWIGKVVRVPSTTTTGNAVYLKAVAKDGQSSAQFGPVIWRETAGYIMQPQTVFCMATVENNYFFLCGSPAGLSFQTGLAVPSYKANSVGDDLSSPLPEFFGRKIDYLGLFQDRLVIGCGATLMFSRPGDYLNFFRKSVATVADDDPWEGFALGTEDDTIKWSTLYDRNLLLFGKRFQYVISGRQPFTPKTASIIVSTAFEDAIDAEPKATGNFVMYAKYSGRPGSEVSSLHQVQAGAIADTPESYKISQQLDTYLSGVPTEIITLTAPNMVLLRTRAERNKVFTYSYLDDAQQGRLFDSWSHWEWSPSVGNIVGLSRDSGDVLIYTLKKGLARQGSTFIYLACERFVRDTGLSDYPYLDSLRTYSDFTTTAEGQFPYLNPVFPPEDAAVVIERRSPLQFIGLPASRTAEFGEQYAAYTGSAWAGVNYPSYVTPTNPYVKDRNDQPILTGRLTLGSVKVAVSETGGMEGYVTRGGQTRQVLDFSGRILANGGNTIGRQPIVSTTLSVIVGGEVRECSYCLQAKKWLPLTVTSIDWTGQTFFNTRRA